MTHTDRKSVERLIDAIWPVQFGLPKDRKQMFRDDIAQPTEDMLRALLTRAETAEAALETSRLDYAYLSERFADKVDEVSKLKLVRGSYDQ